MPWLTPNSDPAMTSWVVFIPDDDVHIAAFWGAIEALENPANWEQYGTVTPEEAAEKWSQAIRLTEDENSS